MATDPVSMYSMPPFSSRSPTSRKTSSSVSMATPRGTRCRALSFQARCRSSTAGEGHDSVGGHALVAPSSHERDQLLSSCRPRFRLFPALLRHRYLSIFSKYNGGLPVFIRYAVQNWNSVE